MAEIIPIESGEPAIAPKLRVVNLPEDELPPQTDWEHMAKSYATMSAALHNNTKAFVQEFDDLRDHLKAVERIATKAAFAAARSEGVILQVLGAVNDMRDRIMKIEARLPKTRKTAKKTPR